MGVASEFEALQVGVRDMGRGHGVGGAGPASRPQQDSAATTMAP